MENSDIVLVSTTDSEEDVQAVLGITKDNRVAGEAPVADETPAGAGQLDDADGEPEDQEDRQGVYMVPPPVPAPQLDAVDADGEPLFQNYEEYLDAHSEWTTAESARRLEERQAALQMHETINARHAEAVTS